MKKKITWTVGEILNPDTDALLPVIQELHAKCNELFKGNHPTVAGVVLAHLTATWLVGHIPTIRETILEAHIESVRLLLAQQIKEREGGQN